MIFPNVCNILDARREKLIPLTIWLFKDDIPWLEKERDRIGDIGGRKAMIVKNSHKFALFVNDMTGRHITEDDYKTED